MDISNNKVSILGTEYEILVQTPQENVKLEDAQGIAELWSKKIILDIAKPEKNSFENLNAFNDKVLRHEIIHAFFHESGLKQYTNDETLVDWLAVQGPKIFKVFMALKLMED